MSIFSLRGLVFSLLTLVSSVQAQESSLWWAQVSTQFHDGRLDAQELAPLLVQVIVRAGGSVHCLADPALQKAIQTPEAWVKSHSLLPADAAGRAQQAVEFSSSALIPLLAQAGCPVPTSPPRLLILWLHGGSMASMPPAWAMPLLHEMHERGLQPLIGNETATGSAGTDLYNGPASVWWNLAQHSGVDSLLLLSDDGQPIASHVSWRWFVAGQDVRGDLSLTEMPTPWPWLADILAEFVAAHRQWPQWPLDQQTLHVSGVRSIADLLGLQGELQRQGFSAIHVVSLQGDVVQLQAHAAWGTALHAGLRLQPIFTPLAAVDPLWRTAMEQVWPVHHLLWQSQPVDAKP